MIWMLNVLREKSGFSTTERARDQNIVASYLSKFRPLCMGPHNVPGENHTNLAKEKTLRLSGS